MDKPFLAAYVDLLIQTCHRRGIHAMGGMAAQIPIKDDPTRERRGDGEGRARTSCARCAPGHDGTWVAHPGLVPIAKRDLRRAHAGRESDRPQARRRASVTRDDCSQVPEGAITEAGLRQNVNVGILYLEAWLGGLGCVPLYNLMEDAATAEISRTQLWQWIRHGARLDDGRAIDAELYRRDPRRGAAASAPGRRRAARRAISSAPRDLRRL